MNSSFDTDGRRQRRRRPHSPAATLCRQSNGLAARVLSLSKRTSRITPATRRTSRMELYHNRQGAVHGLFPISTRRDSFVNATRHGWTTLPSWLVKAHCTPPLPLSWSGKRSQSCRWKPRVKQGISRGRVIPSNLSDRVRRANLRRRPCLFFKEEREIPWRTSEQVPRGAGFRPAPRSCISLPTYSETHL